MALPQQHSLVFSSHSMTNQRMTQESCVQNARYEAAHRLHNDLFLFDKPHYLSFFSPSSELCRGKRSSTHLVQFNKQRHGRKFPWTFRCCIQPSQDPLHKGKVLQARTMEETYDALAKRLLSAMAATPSPSKYIVGLAGPPGAGKSTVAKEVSKRVNALWLQTNSSVERESGTPQNDVAIALPMDGFHLYRSQLDMMEDPAEAHARRGAPWTFDPDGLLKCLTTLRSQGWVLAPSFDHGVGDPKENDIIVTRSHRVIVVEGNYLLLSDDKWKVLMDMFDDRWYLDVDMEITLNRVVKRFVVLELLHSFCSLWEASTGYSRADEQWRFEFLRLWGRTSTFFRSALSGKPPEQVKARVEYNDRKNAELILASKVNADLIIKSVELQRCDSTSENTAFKKS